MQNEYEQYKTERLVKLAALAALGLSMINFGLIVEFIVVSMRGGI